MAQETTDKPKCEHPSYYTEGDGHGRYWYRCTKCGEVTHWPPWLFAQNSDYGDIGL